ncbi:unnamed protein product [Fraxinus pennsylvanica]|uniref:Uncharacterized protein n=1 Tax=Fraxinus pennsylvanica TaxID=56036 RepID=A0AAD2ADS7_9LAMI|nr:unnamed protein product [Fraxinus pennsylvanica]
MSSNNHLLMITGNHSMFRSDSGGIIIPTIKRSDFPKDFVFGAATSAYQVEGAWNVQGKGRSNWDVFTMSEPAGIDDGSNGCTAIDQYNLLKDDVDLMKKVGLDSYRFSIAWTRILPGGRICKGICKEGIKYYNDLIDILLAAGIEPCVTLFHWDVPECLELEYQGFLSDKILQDFPAKKECRSYDKVHTVCILIQLSIIFKPVRLFDVVEYLVQRDWKIDEMSVAELCAIMN